MRGEEKGKEMGGGYVSVGEDMSDVRVHGIKHKGEMGVGRRREGCLMIRLEVASVPQSSLQSSR